MPSLPAHWLIIHQLGLFQVNIDDLRCGSFLQLTGNGHTKLFRYATEIKRGLLIKPLGPFSAHKPIQHVSDIHTYIEYYSVHKAFWAGSNVVILKLKKQNNPKLRAAYKNTFSWVIKKGIWGITSPQGIRMKRHYNNIAVPPPQRSHRWGSTKE